MAGDRHGKHNTTTISFRVNSYEKATIEERVKAVSYTHLTLPTT